MRTRSDGTPTVTIHVSDVVPLSDHVGPVDPVPVLFGLDTRKRDATASAAVLAATIVLTVLTWLYVFLA